MAPATRKKLYAVARKKWNARCNLKSRFGLTLSRLYKDQLQKYLNLEVTHKRGKRGGPRKKKTYKSASTVVSRAGSPVMGAAAAASSSGSRRSGRKRKAPSRYGN